MQFEVEIGGRVRVVAIERVGATGAAGGRFRIRIDDGVHEVDARRTHLGLTLVFPDDNRSVDLALSDLGRGEWLAQFPHVDLTALVDASRRERGGGPVAAAGTARVTAPMPGRVVRILVKPGDDVALRQGLVVVEAMKMENELGSPKAGRVKEIAVTEGQSVEAGRLLIIVE